MKAFRTQKGGGKMTEDSDFEYAVKTYGAAVYGIIRSAVSDKSTADDVYQEVFLLYYTKELHFEDEAARRSWLIRTALFMTRSANRSSRRRNDSTDDADTGSIPADGRTAKEQALWVAVCGLKEKYRLPVLLHYFDGMPVNEAAKVLRINENTFKSRLARARKLLEKELGQT